MLTRFMKNFKLLFTGYDIGLRSDFHLVGEIPIHKSREERRREGRFVKAKRRA